MTMKVTSRAEKAVEELMNEALDAAEPGDKDGSVVEGFKEHGAAAALSVESAGYVKVWNIETGDLSIINKNMLATQLNKKNDGMTAPHLKGQRAFTTDPTKVKGTPVVGTLKCLLHPEHPDRAMHAALGFLTCKKANLRNPLDVRTHMRARHKREWDSLENSKQETVATEERLVRQALIRQNTARPLEMPVPAPDIPKPEPIHAVREDCPKCGLVITARPGGLHVARRHHQKKCAPPAPAAG